MEVFNDEIKRIQTGEVKVDVYIYVNQLEKVAFLDNLNNENYYFIVKKCKKAVGDDGQDTFIPYGDNLDISRINNSGSLDTHNQFYFYIYIQGIKGDYNGKIEVTMKNKIDDTFSVSDISTVPRIHPQINLAGYQNGGISFGEFYNDVFFNGEYVPQFQCAYPSIFKENLSITKNASIDGALGVTGNTTLSGTLDVTKAATLKSTLGVTGNATLSGTLGVTGNTTLSGTLGVTKAATFTSTVKASGGLLNVQSGTASSQKFSAGTDTLITIKFPTSFSSTPTVVVSFYGGVNGTGFTQMQCGVQSGSITTSQFQCRVRNSHSSDHTTSVAWIAYSKNG